MENQMKSYPIEIVNVDPEIAKEVKKYHTGGPSDFILLGPNRYFLPKMFKQQASEIYHMEVRTTDTWVVTTFRSGTTIMQELIWQISHILDFEKDENEALPQKFPYLEMSSLVDPELIEQLVKDNPESEVLTRSVKDPIVDRLAEIKTPRFIKSHLPFSLLPPACTVPLLGKGLPTCSPIIHTMSMNHPNIIHIVDHLAEIKTPRFIKSHLPFSLLPPGLLNTAKVVYLTRDPRDVAVSFYHLCRLIKTHGFEGDFTIFWQQFVNGLIYYTPFFDQVKEAWANRQHPNMLFLFYEDMVKDMPRTIRRVASHLGKEITDEQVNKLTDHLRIEKCRKNRAMNMDPFKEAGWEVAGEERYIRKGKSGGWRDYFDADMTRQAEQWIANNLKDTDLRFPN